MVKNISSLDFLQEIARLDAIPLEISPGLFPLVAQTMRVDADLLRELTAHLRESVVAGLIKYLLADDEPAEQPIRQRQYELLTGKWLKAPEFREYARLVDSPYQLMPKEALAALSEGPEEVFLNYLRRWHDQYPAMAGLAVKLAGQLIKRKEYDEAKTRLERSATCLCYEPTRRHINYFLVQILLREMERATKLLQPRTGSRRTASASTVRRSVAADRSWSKFISEAYWNVKLAIAASAPGDTAGLASSLEAVAWHRPATRPVNRLRAV